MRRQLLLFASIAVALHAPVCLAQSAKRSTRPPLPAPADLQAAESRLRSAIKQELAKQGQTEEAAAWRELVARYEGDPIAQCVLLIRTRELAQAAGDISRALESIDALSERYEFNCLGAKASSLEGFVISALTKQSRGLLLEAVHPLLEESLRAEQFDLAERFAKVSLIAANNDRNLRRQVRGFKLVVERARDQAAAINEAAIAARECLAEDPDDRGAHGDLGRHLCFAESDWERGLEHLQRSADESLAALAREEMRSPARPEEQLALADAWWELGIAPDGAGQRARIILRAAYWYRQAIRGLDGQAKARANQRLEQAMNTILRVESPRINPHVKAVEVTLREDVSLRLVKVPGQFVHGGTIAEFYLSATEVTQEQWMALLTKNPSTQRGDGSLPVHDLTHGQAEQFIEALNRSPLAGQFEFRLPTPAEWLHAYGGAYYRNEKVLSSLLDKQAWRQNNSGGRLHVVGQLAPNHLGLYDMLGNCAEWTSEPRRVFGFSYVDRINASRLFKQPPILETPDGHHSASIGFRVAADLAFGAELPD